MSCHQEELGISPKTAEKYDEHIKIKPGKGARAPLTQTRPELMSAFLELEQTLL
jgi:hypothetical protein